MTKTESQSWCLLLCARIFSSFAGNNVYVNMPDVGYCGADTNLSCHYTAENPLWSWEKNRKHVIMAGNILKTNWTEKYKSFRYNQSFILTVKNTDMSDEGNYSCAVGNSTSTMKLLKVECISLENMHIMVTKAKKVQIVFEKVYHIPPQINVSLFTVDSAIQTNGSYMCNTSVHDVPYSRCVWESSVALKDGLYNSTIQVTRSRTINITKSFNISLPYQVTIANVTSGHTSSQKVIRCIEDYDFNLTCTSRGGYPQPTLALYQVNNGSSSIVNASVTEILDTNMLYDVTAVYTFIPRRKDDSSILICRPYNPELQTSINDSVTLVLSLKPSHPIIEPQNISATLAENINISCEIHHCRPPANITWEHNGKTMDGANTLELDNVSHTFTVWSVVTINVKQKDDAGFVYCIVTQEALMNPLKANASLNILDGVCRAPLLAHGYFNNSTENNKSFYDVGETVTPVCNYGYRLNISNVSMKCQTNNRWSAVARCLASCDVPYLEHGNATKELGADGEALTIICEDGYQINITSNTVRCQNDRTWSDYFGCIVKRNAAKVKSHVTWNAAILIASGCICMALLVGAGIGIAIYRKRLIAHTTYLEDEEECNGDMMFALKNVTYANVSRTNMCGYMPEEVSAATYSNCRNTEYDSIPSTAIRIKQLFSFVFNQSDTAHKLHVEYESFPRGLQAAHTAASKDENKSKNKYKNIFPYDETRVVLCQDSKHQSDYINANFIHGFSQTRKYVACQGPTKNTINDFWRMIWQLDSSKIVMLTNLIEKNTNKCHQYWPSKKREIYGNIIVTLTYAEIFSEFVIRRLFLEKHSETKLVTQFHFTAWPDKNVPKYESSLVHFRNKVKYAPAHGEGPLIVHCSAGVGRTGVFIALDYLIDQAKTLEYVDVYRCVQTLRTQRVNLVQTLEQYIFLHHALVESLSLLTSGVSASQFPETYNILLRLEPSKGKRLIDTEFEMMTKLAPISDESQYQFAKNVCNRNKNRYLNILPAEEYMPILTNCNDNDSGYINAVFLPNYKQKRAFIITQSPLESTKADFWNLVYEYNVHTIVMMNHITELKFMFRISHLDRKTKRFRNG